MGARCDRTFKILGNSPIGKVAAFRAVHEKTPPSAFGGGALRSRAAGRRGALE